MNISFSPAELDAIFNARGIDPDEEFIAAAGVNTGYVLAWELPDGDYLIAYGNDSNGDRYYTVTDDTNNLARFLEDNSLFGLDSLVQIANIHGPEYIDVASPRSEGPFYIVKTRHWFDQKISEAVEDEDRRPRKFSTYAEAQAWIDAEKAKPYEKAPDEIDVPSYVIVSLPD
jgi:hypothetical protein